MVLTCVPTLLCCKNQCKIFSLHPWVSKERLVTYCQLQLPVWHRSRDAWSGNFCRTTAQIRLAVVMCEGHFLNCERTQESSVPVDSAISREVGGTEEGSRVWGPGSISPHPDLDNPSETLFPSDPRLCHADNSYILGSNKSLYSASLQNHNRRWVLRPGEQVLAAISVF